MNNKDLFPKINLSANPTWKEYITAWINKYNTADQNSPSTHIGSPSQSPYDPLINIIVQNVLGANQNAIQTIQQYHTLYIQAENVAGGLLEEYIASKALNWIWCKGETVRSIDFYNIDFNCVLQIKNKYNTENSSSIAIRNDTSIQKWCRLKKH